MLERRVLAVTDLSTGLHDAHGELIGRGLREEDAGPFLDLLGSFALGQEDMFVLSRLPHGIHEGEFSGLSVKSLQAELARRSTVVLPPDLALLLEASKPRAVAVMSAGEKVYATGSADLCAGLERFAQLRADGQDAADSVILWTDAFDNGDGLVLARQGAIEVWMICGPDETLRVLRLWQDGLFLLIVTEN